MNDIYIYIYITLDNPESLAYDILLVRGSQTHINTYSDKIPVEQFFFSV